MIDYTNRPDLVAHARTLSRALAPLVPVLLANLGFASIEEWRAEQDRRDAERERAETEKEAAK